MSFEDALNELEKIVRQIEMGAASWTMRYRL